MASQACKDEAPKLRGFAPDAVAIPCEWIPNYEPKLQHAQRRLKHNFWQELQVKADSKLEVTILL